MQHSCPMRRLHPDMSDLCFTCRQSLFRAFNAMVDGIPQNVVQRRFHFFKNVPIHISGLTEKFKLYSFPKFFGQVAHQSRKSLHSIGKGSHSGPDHRMVKVLRQVQEAPGIVTQGINLVRNVLHASFV